MAYVRGYEPWNKGKKHSPETIEKFRIASKNQKNRGGPKGSWSEARRKAQLERAGKPYASFPRKKKPSHLKKPFVMSGKEYHPMWRDIRKLVYKRDGYSCKDCGRHCHNSLKIQCHHVDYDVSNNDFSNLVTLCASCHSKTNFRREHWIAYFRDKLK